MYYRFFIVCLVCYLIVNFNVLGFPKQYSYDIFDSCTYQESKNNESKCLKYTNECNNAIKNNNQLESRCILQEVYGFATEYKQGFFRCVVTIDCLTLNCNLKRNSVSTYNNLVNYSRVCEDGTWGFINNCKWGLTKNECSTITESPNTESSREDFIDKWDVIKKIVSFPN